MPNELGRALVAADVITPEALADAVFHATTRGIPLPRALVDVGALDEARLDEELDRRGDSPLPHVSPSQEIIDALPAGLIERLYCIPIGYGSLEGGGLDVQLAVVDTADTHAADEVAYHLRAPVTPVRATLAAIEGALVRIRAGRISSVPPERRPTPAPFAMRYPGGPPAIEAGYASSEPLAAAGAVTTSENVPQAAPSSFPPDPTSANIPILLTKRGIDGLNGNGTHGTHERSRVDLTPPYPFGLDQLETLDVLQRRALEASRAPLLPTLFPEVNESAGMMPDEDPIPLSRPARSKTPAQLPAVPYPDVGALFAAIRVATERDRVLDLLIAGVRTIAKRVALFIVKRDRLVGWRCSSLFGDERSFRRLEMSLDEPSLLAHLVQGEPFIGPLSASPFAAPIVIAGDRGATANGESAKSDVAGTSIARELRLSGRDFAVATIHIEGIPALVLVADDLADPFLVRHRLEDFTKVSGQAMARILRSRR